MSEPLAPGMEPVDPNEAANPDEQSDGSQPEPEQGSDDGSGNDDQQQQPTP